ncbi:MAG TPA: PAC2 family protein [Chloroflexota bacterium]|nr:PAC2 family protein [Chloroflexota bacterium]
MSHVRYIEEPKLRRPVLILAFAGWNDASEVATTSVKFLSTRWKAKKFADIDPEEFYNFARVRPHVHIEEDFSRTITWPENTFYYHVDPLLDRDFVLLLGIEPNLKWRTFCEEVLHVAHEAGVTSMLSLGGLIADVPHTRPPRLTAFSSDPDLTARFPELALRRSRYEGPTGIVGVLSDVFTKSGIPVGSIWGNVPHYISASPNPKVAHSILSRLNTIYGLGLELSELERAGRRFERQVNEALSNNPEVQQYVSQLEAREEPTEEEAPPQRQAEGPVDLPRGEDIVRQLEEYLRQQATEKEEGNGDSS